MTEQDEETKKVYDHIDNKVDQAVKDGFIPKAEMDKLLEIHGKLNIAEMVNHECTNDDCGICRMKSGIDGAAFKRGTIAGIKLGRKYPNLKVD